MNHLFKYELTKNQLLLNYDILLLNNE